MREPRSTGSGLFVGSNFPQCAGAVIIGGFSPMSIF